MGIDKLNMGFWYSSIVNFLVGLGKILMFILGRGMLVFLNKNYFMVLILWIRLVECNVGVRCKIRGYVLGIILFFFGVLMLFVEIIDFLWWMRIIGNVNNVEKKVRVIKGKSGIKVRSIKIIVVNMSDWGCLVIWEFNFVVRFWCFLFGIWVIIIFVLREISSDGICLYKLFLIDSML